MARRSTISLLAKWITKEFGIECKFVGELNLKNSTDKEIFHEARKNNVIIITKDSDFHDLLLKNGSPPKVIWLTCGNTSNERLKSIFQLQLAEALKILQTGNDLVEITGLMIV